MTRKKLNIASQTVIVIGITLIGKILGLVREAYVAADYGASYIADVYVLENSIVNAICTILLCVVTTAFIPLYIEAKQNRSEQTFVTNVLVSFFMFSVIISVVLMFIPEVVVSVVAPGILGKYPSDILHIIFLSIQISMVNVFLLTMQGLLRAIMQANDKIHVSALQAIVLNVVMITYLALFARLGLIGLAVAMVIAQASIVIFFLIYLLRKYMLAFSWRGIKCLLSDCRSMLLLALPVLLMSVLSQASYIIDKTVASGFDEGTLAMIGYATTIGLAIYSVFGESINNVVFPRFCKMTAARQQKRLNDFGMLVTLIASIPVAAFIAGVMVAANPIIEVIYGHGAFSSNDVVITALYLLIYMPGMLFFYERDYLNRMCYAQKKTALPSVCAAIGFVLTIVLNLTIPRYIGAQGIVCATTVAMTVAFWVQFIAMLRLGYLLDSVGWLKIYITIVLSFAAAFFMGNYALDVLQLENTVLGIPLAFVTTSFTYCAVLIATNIMRFKQLTRKKDIIFKG